jgi:hypothetical protein
MDSPPEPHASLEPDSAAELQEAEGEDRPAGEAGSGNNFVQAELAAVQSNINAVFENELLPRARAIENVS